MRITKKEKEELAASSRRVVERIGKTTTVLLVDEGKPSTTGRTHYTSAYTLDLDTDGHVLANITMSVARVIGYRLSKDGRIMTRGFGYCRTDKIATALANALGRRIFVICVGDSYGPQGWVEPTSIL